MPAVRGVIFDLFDTLVPFSAQQWDALSAEMAGLLAPADPSRFIQEWLGWTAARMTGDLEAVLRDACAIAVPSAPETAIALALQLNAARHEEWLTLPRPDARSVLVELRRRGVRTGLISNCSSSVPGSWPASPLGDLIDVAVFSAAEGVAKPDPRIYRRTIERLGLTANECLYVDDSAGACAGAAAIGLHAIQYLPPGGRDGRWTGPAVASLSEVIALLPDANP
ncbi:MAG TPA: HAD-IA family hydrolase [Candidatus Limnocylindria bacterium]